MFFPRPAPFALALALALARATHAEEPTESKPSELTGVIDSALWQTRFAAYVERVLAREQLRQAVNELAEPEPYAALRVLDELEEREILWARERPQLPDSAMPGLSAVGAHGRVLDAAKAWTSGAKRTALDILREPELRGDGLALHLRSQLLDELSAGASGLFRLAVIDLYREALRLQPASPEAARARLRIAQIYLEQRFFAEARAELRASGELAEPYTIAGRLTHAEAAFLARDPKVALALLERLDDPGVTPELREHALRRRAESYARLGRFAEARSTFRSLEASPRTRPAAPLESVRSAWVALRAGEPGDAKLRAEALLLAKPELRRDRALAGLVFARALRALDQPDPVAKVASAVAAEAPLTHVAALASVESIEAETRRGGTQLALSEGTAALAGRPSASEPVGLLAFRAAVRAAPGDSRTSAVERLAAIAYSLPGGEVRRLALEELARRTAHLLVPVALGDVAPEPSLVELAERTFRPEVADENGLLLALAAISQASHRGTCLRWARVLQGREARPLRRGLAAWREATCLDLTENATTAAKRLRLLADGGSAGPFALALSAFAAERELAAGSLASAVASYQRGLEAFTEPALEGPVSLRAAELLLAIGEPALARRRALAGLAALGNDELAGDPLWRIGWLTLARATPPGDRATAKRLRETGERETGFWRGAFAFLAWRLDGRAKPDGDAPFATALAELERVAQIEATADGLTRRQRLAKSAAPDVAAPAAGAP